MCGKLSHRQLVSEILLWAVNESEKKNQTKTLHILAGFLCISYFYIAGIKRHEQGNLKKEELTGAYSSKEGRVQHGREAWRGGTAASNMAAGSEMLRAPVSTSHMQQRAEHFSSSASFRKHSLKSHTCCSTPTMHCFFLLTDPLLD